MDRINCPNCSAPIEPYMCKCPYCGTWYFDLAAFDFEDGKPCYIKIRKSYIDGKKYTLTTLARPSINSITINRNTCDAVNSRGVVDRITTGYSGEIEMNFTMSTTQDNNVLYTIEVED